jgi:hypothetical protein
MAVEMIPHHATGHMDSLSMLDIEHNQAFQDWIK